MVQQQKPGLRNNQEQTKTENKDIAIQKATADQKEYHKTWSMLLRKVFEIDPLICPAKKLLKKR